MQDRDQLKKKIKLRVFDVDEDNVDESTKLSKFLKQKLNNFDFDDYARAYYEFADDKMDLLHYREVMEVSNSKVFYVRFDGLMWGVQLNLFIVVTVYGSNLLISATHAFTSSIHHIFTTLKQPCSFLL